MLLAETDEQNSRTRGQNRHANAETLQLEETLAAAKKIWIEEKQEEIASEGTVELMSSLQDTAKPQFFSSVPAPHHLVIKGSDWVEAMVMNICCLTSLAVLPMLVGNERKPFSSPQQAPSSCLEGLVTTSGQLAYKHITWYSYILLQYSFFNLVHNIRERRQEQPKLWILGDAS